MCLEISNSKYLFDEYSCTRMLQRQNIVSSQTRVTSSASSPVSVTKLCSLNMLVSITELVSEPVALPSSDMKLWFR